MCAKLALGQSDGFYQDFQGVELQRIQSESLPDDVYHPLILGRTGHGILLQILVLVTFQFLDNTTGY